MLRCRPMCGRPSEVCTRIDCGPPTSFSSSSCLARNTEMCDVLLLSSCRLLACMADDLLLFGLVGAPPPDGVAPFILSSARAPDISCVKVSTRQMSNQHLIASPFLAEKIFFRLSPGRICGGWESASLVGLVLMPAHGDCVNMWSRE